MFILQALVDLWQVLALSLPARVAPCLRRARGGNSLRGGLFALGVSIIPWDEASLTLLMRTQGKLSAHA